MIEKSLVIIKPGCLERGIVGSIISRIESKGLTIEAMKLMKLDAPVLKTHYAHHSDKPFFNDLISYMTSSSSIIMIISGKDAVTVMRNMAGPTKIEETKPGTIRGDFALSTSRNVIHTSDAIETAKREIELFFS